MPTTNGRATSRLCINSAIDMEIPTFRSIETWCSTRCGRTSRLRPCPVRRRSLQGRRAPLAVAARSAAKRKMRVLNHTVSAQLLPDDLRVAPELGHEAEADASRHVAGRFRCQAFAAVLGDFVRQEVKRGADRLEQALLGVFQRQPRPLRPGGRDTPAARPSGSFSHRKRTTDASR